MAATTKQITCPRCGSPATTVTTPMQPKAGRRLVYGLTFGLVGLIFGGKRTEIHCPKCGMSVFNLGA